MMKKYNFLKVYLNGEDATRFKKIKQKLNYKQNSVILRMIIQNYIRAAGKWEEAQTESDPFQECNSFSDGIVLKDEGLVINRGSVVGSNHRSKKELKRERVEGKPMQIKTNLSENEMKRIDEIIKKSTIKTRYEVGKTLIDSFLKRYDPKEEDVLNEALAELVKIRKKREKSE